MQGCTLTCQKQPDIAPRLPYLSCATSSAPEKTQTQRFPMCGPWLVQAACRVCRFPWLFIFALYGIFSCNEISQPKSTSPYQRSPSQMPETSPISTGGAQETSGDSSFSPPPSSASSTPNRRPVRQARSKGLQSLAEPLMFDQVYAGKELEKRPKRAANAAAGAEFAAAGASAAQTGADVAGNVLVNGVAGFTEPELATPVPIYTGLPLESFPTAKIKKDSLWSVRKHPKRKTPDDSEPIEILPSPPPSEEDTGSIEEKYKMLLKTSKSDQFSTASSVRKPIRQNLKAVGKLRTPKQSLRDVSGTKQLQLVFARTVASPEDLRVKRIKVISPKKPSSTNLSTSSTKPVSPGGTVSTRASSVSSSVVAEDDEDDTKDNDDFCFTCGGPGVFICCENCPKSFHFTCCDPPLEEVPEDIWHCLECRWKLSQPKPKSSFKNSSKISNIFDKLLERHESRNPREFSLPDKFRNETFIGVQTGNNGHYEDDSLKPELTLRQRQQISNQIQGYNYDRDLEIDTLYDKLGRPYLCQGCSQLGLHGRTLAHCDYCSLCWHIDCLDPPLLTPKTIGSKWKCPNHVEELLMLGLKAKCRQFLNTRVLDVSLQNQFLKIANANNFLIKQKEDPLIDRDIKLVDFEEEVGELQKDVIVEAEPESKLKKILKNSCGAIMYRIPEELIILDFIDKGKEQKRKIMDSIEDYTILGRLEEEPEEKLAIDGLNAMNNDEDKQTQTQKQKLNFKELIEVATKEILKLEEVEIEKDELKELRNIKQLMQMKGRESLLKFLQS